MIKTGDRVQDRTHWQTITGMVKEYREGRKLAKVLWEGEREPSLVPVKWLEKV